MIYQSALARETQEMIHAEEIHPDYSHDGLQEFIRKKYVNIIFFTEKLKEPKTDSQDTGEMLVYVGYDKDGNKNIKYEKPDGTGIYKAIYVTRDEFSRIMDTESENIKELLDHYIK